MDKTFFAKLMRGMAVVLKNQDTATPEWPLTLEIFWQRFKDWPDERFKAAVDRHMECAVFFPTPAELIALGTIQPDTAHEAWERVKRAMDTAYHPDLGWYRRSSLTPREVEALEAAGGPRLWALGSMTDVSVMQTRFLQHYRVLQDREEERRYPALGHPDGPGSVLPQPEQPALERKEGSDA